MSDELTAGASREIPRIPASAGALIFDDAGSLLILKTTYKKRWSIPGGEIEDDGESPWEACRRETLEECGLRVERGALVCVDFLRPRQNRRGGLRFLFNCGRFGPERLAAITLQPEEIERHRFARPSDAIALLTRPIGRRVAASLGASRCIYLEDGKPANGVTNAP